MLGVSISIRDSAKLREKDDLPGKISRIENAIDILERVTEIDLAFDARSHKNRFVQVDYSTMYKILDDYNELTEIIPKKLKNDFIYIDAEAYQMYLRFKDQVQLLGMTFINEVGLESEDYKDSKVTSLAGFIDFLYKRDKKFTYQLGMIYADLHVQLALKHEQLIEELDY
ncbi:hypothetical protein AU377_02940 [Sporosarcina sp. HYO08]|nr:hypothetical protein AU377_02940 [Sporosarcina sp. HYO08]